VRWYILYWLIILMGAVDALAAWKIWHHTTAVFDKMWPSWPYGERQWFSAPRVIVPLSAFTLLLGVGGLIMQVGLDTQNYGVMALGLLITCLGVPPLLLAYVIRYFNRPRWLVPPWLRDRHGLIGEWREERSEQRRRQQHCLF
jgi:hypothetical protein